MKKIYLLKKNSNFDWLQKMKRLHTLTKEKLIEKLSDIEWEDFEVKKAKSEVPKACWETVSAFSNTSGGWLIFGVSKIGKKYVIIGVDNSEKIEQDFTNTLRGGKFNIKIYIEALREALVNMLMHTDYFSTGKSRIRIFDNKIEFYNPGGLPQSIEKLMEYDTSMPRNPIIARLFRVVKLAENAGYGFDKMIKGWKSYRNNKPDFVTHIDSTIVTFPIKKITESDNKNSESGGSIGGSIGSSINLTERQNEILQIIRSNNKISYRKIAEILKINESAIKKHLNVLRGKNAIERIGGTRGYWKILIEFRRKK